MNRFSQDELVLDQVVPGSSRETIALFSSATEDPNPIHVDDAFAKSCGFPQVIQQGPMTTAYFAALLDRVAGGGALKTLDVSFTAPVFPGESLRFQARVTEVAADVTLALTAQKDDGTLTAKGVAVLRNEAPRR